MLDARTISVKHVPPGRDQLSSSLISERASPAAVDHAFALDTACADLQAQMEASDRTIRLLDHDIAEIDERLATSREHGNLLGEARRHLKDLRHNLDQQRIALRLVRAEMGTLRVQVPEAPAPGQKKDETE
jgi:hypothetical protein